MNVAQDLDNQQSWLLWVWNGISNFLHHAQLIPFIVAVSGYHILQVLVQYDKWWSSIPLAMFIDLLHYRTVDRAIKKRTAGWRVGAAFTTVVVFLFQMIFYSRPVENGASLDIWQQVLFASIVPVGIIFMVWHHHENEQAEADETHEELIETQATAAELEGKLTEAQAAAEKAHKSAQQAHEDARQARATANEAHEKLTATITTADAQQEEIERLQGELTQLQMTLDETHEIRTLWGQLNPKTQNAARVSMGLLTVQEAAAAASVSGDTIRRTQKLINGHQL